MKRLSSCTATVLLLAAFVLASRPAALAQQTEHFTCYKAKTTSGTSKFVAIPGVTIVDAFRSSTVTVIKPERLCAPTNKLGEDPTAPQHPDHLESYKAKPTVKFAGASNLRIVDQFGTVDVIAKKPVGLLVPTLKSLGGPAPTPTSPAVDHFQCYKVKITPGTPKFIARPDITIEDQFGTMTVLVKKPRRLCVPANKNNEEPGAENHSDHLMCYLVKQTSLPKFATIGGINVNNQFGPQALDARKPVELCVPALKNPPTGPTTTPTPVGPTSTPTVTMTPTPTETATPIPFFRLSVTRVGSGTVTSDPAGIDCGGDCIEDYQYPTVVTLDATPAAGFSFMGWGDACSGTGTCQITMDAAKNVDATFIEDVPICTNSDPTLTLSPAPDPGPAVLYTDAPEAPQLQNLNARFTATPLLVAGHEAYVAGEYMYQDYVYDDFGAETSGGPFNTTFVTSPPTGTATQDAANYNTGDVTYPTNTARYGNNAADLLELRIAPGPDDIAYRVTLNTLLANDTTMVAIAWNSDNNLNSGAATLSRNPGATVRGTDEVIYLWGEGTGPSAVAKGEHVRFTGNGTTATSTTTTALPGISIDLDANQITALVPRTIHDPSGNLWRYVVMTGLHNGSGTWVRPAAGNATSTTPGGGGPADQMPVALFDLNNHYAVADGQAGHTGELCHFLDAPCDMVQAVDLRRVNGITAPELSKYARTVDYAQLAAPTSSTTVPGGANGLAGIPVPTNGTVLVRIFPSRLVIAPAEGRNTGLPGVPSNDTVFFHGQMQHYSLFIPGGPTAVPPLPLTWANHSLAQFHPQYNGTDFVQQIGQLRGSLVATPNSRAYDGFYVGRNEYDYFEVWNDILRNYDVDMSRVAMTGYSMGGYATYRMPSLYPDLFGKAYSIVGPPGAGIWNGTGGASISEDKGNDYSTLTNYWLENVRNVPFFNMAMQTDELVPIDGTRQQNIGGVDATGEAQSFDGLGYRYTYQEFTSGEHVTLFLNDAYPMARDFLGTAQIDADPVHVTFSSVPESDRADLTLVHDHAYWVSRLTLRNAVGMPTGSGSKSAKGTIDAYSYAFGEADPVVSAQTSAPGTLTGGNVGPLAYTQYQRTWAAPLPITPENRLSLALTNLRSVQVDVARAALDSNVELILDTTSDGATTLDLFGIFPSGTAIYEDSVRLCIADGAMVGPVGARVPVKSGIHQYRLRLP